MNDRVSVTVRADAEPQPPGPVDLYTADEALDREEFWLEQSRKASEEMRVHVAALKGASGPRRDVIQAFLANASCLARRSKQWAHVYVLAAEKLSGPKTPVP